MEKLNTRQKIRIDGYWVPDGEVFNGYVCVVNDATIRKDDEEIFFYFDSWTDVESFKKKGVHDFVVTGIRGY